MIEAYFPDATDEANGAMRGDYSQTLGARAAAALPGASVTRWKRGATPPKPTLVQTKRPKRQLGDVQSMLTPMYSEETCMGTRATFRPHFGHLIPSPFRDFASARAIASPSSRPEPAFQ